MASAGITFSSLRRFGLITILGGLLAGSALADLFTGPTSPYYLDNYGNDTIYVVQGATVINSFAWAYDTIHPYAEGTLAVSSTVNTRPFPQGSLNANGGIGGQYTLSGTPTGVSEPYTLPPGSGLGEYSYDGTSDGLHNYYVQYYGMDATGHLIENVYQTDLTWQNPTELFSVQSSPGDFEEYMGIAYDSKDQSLWISGYNDSTINEYSLSGTLLFSFNPGHGLNTALGYDAADNTLWMSFNGPYVLEQYSTTGTLLQFGIPTGLPDELYASGDFSTAPAAVPEPSSVVLLLSVLGGFTFLVRKRTGSFLNCAAE